MFTPYQPNRGFLSICWRPKYRALSDPMQNTERAVRKSTCANKCVKTVENRRIPNTQNFCLMVFNVYAELAPGMA
jgi:hypothetical protein